MVVNSSRPTVFSEPTEREMLFLRVSKIVLRTKSHWYSQPHLIKYAGGMGEKQLQKENERSVFLFVQVLSFLFFLFFNLFAFRFSFPT